MMTGTECGGLSELDADESSVGPDGKTFTFRKMGEINVCGAKNGDSGGPLYKKHRAFGIFQAHSTTRVLKPTRVFAGQRQR